jgi:hypothetical protein
MPNSTNTSMHTHTLYIAPIHLSIIFSFLRVQSDFPRVAAVCRYWKDVLYRGLLQLDSTSPSPEFIRIDPWELTEVVASPFHPRITHVIVNDERDILSVGEMSHFRHLSHIKHINASIVTSNVKLPRLQGIIRSVLPIYARHLNLRFCVAAAEEIRPIMDAILGSSSLPGTLEVLCVAFSRTPRARYTNFSVELEFSQLSRLSGCTI